MPNWCASATVELARKAAAITTPAHQTLWIVTVTVIDIKSDECHTEVEFDTFAGSFLVVFHIDRRRSVRHHLISGKMTNLPAPNMVGFGNQFAGLGSRRFSRKNT
jgi:hypothetical protein